MKSTLALLSLLLYQLDAVLSLSALYTLEMGSMVGKTVLITGGTTGLGGETVERLKDSGANIMFTARNNKKVRGGAEASITSNEKAIPSLFPP